MRVQTHSAWGFLGILALSSSVSASCGSPTLETLYSAHFEWKNGNRVSRPMTLVISKNKRPGFNESRVVAQIFSESRCEAICQVTSMETQAQMGSLDMSCKSVAFGTLATPATVFFRTGSAAKKAGVLRFGSWIHGYEQATLIVEKNRSARLLRLMTRKPIQLAKAQ